MKIITRIIGGFAVVLILTTLVGVIGWNGLGQFVKGVNEAQEMASLAEQSNKMQLNVVEFKATGDPVNLTEARDHMETVKSGIATATEHSSSDQQRENLGVLSDVLLNFENALVSFSQLNDDNIMRLEDMRQKKAEVEKLALSIRNVQTQKNQALSFSLSAAENEQKKRLGLDKQAQKLIMSTLSARQAEAMYQLTQKNLFTTQANGAMKDMFMSSLGMKKLAKGTPDEVPVAKVIPVVNAYRKGFGDLISAQQDGLPTDEISAELGKISARINSYTSFIAKRQQSSYNTASEQAQKVRKEAAAASIIQLQTTEMVSQLRELEKAEAIFIASHNPADAESVSAAVKSILGSSLRLKRSLAKTPQAESVNQMVMATKGYSTAFDAVAVAIADQDKAEDAMRTAQNEIISLIAKSNIAKTEEMDSIKTSSTTWIATGSILAVIIGALFAYIIGMGISRPVSRMTEAMNDLAEGNLEIDIPGEDRKDEIGNMAAAVVVFKNNAIEVKRMTAEQEEHERRAVEERKKMMIEMADNFEASVGNVIKSVGEASREMETSAKNMSSTAERTSERSATVASAALEASTNVQNVSAATEELSISIDEISRQVDQSSQTAQAAAAEAAVANQKVGGLETAAAKIGEVVMLITDIAEQTNLLALNATIEAARAGDAGKGFAVVASEVKNLANQTAKATEDISLQVDGIQSATKDSVQAIQSISSTIEKVNETAASIAAAIEEQGAATREIARNVEQASHGTSEVTENIVGVNDATEETGKAAEHALVVAGQLSAESETLRTEVTKFLDQVRNG